MTRCGFAISMAGACAAAYSQSPQSTTPVDAARTSLSVAEVPSQIRSRQVTPTQLVQACLAISVPCGFASKGLPVGLMIAGPRFSESRVLALAAAFEKGTEWHKRKPPLSPDMPVPTLAVTEEA